VRRGPSQVRPLRAPASRRGLVVILALAPVFLLAGAGLALLPRLTQAGGGSATVTTLAAPTSPPELAGLDRAREQATPPPIATPGAPLQRPWRAATNQMTYDPRLAAALDAAFAPVDGRLSVLVKDLGSGRGAALAEDVEMPAASLFKLPVLYSIFAAHVPFDAELLITEGIKAYDLGTLELGPGETLSVAEALERMVTLSDNASAILLANRVGSARIDADLANLGMTTTHYSAERLTTSAADMATLLERIARGQAVSLTASADMDHLLLRQRVNDRLPRLLPDAAQVAHKTGNLPGTVNDVGIIYGLHSTVLVAALVSDAHDEAAAADAIARAALASYSYFEDQPEVADRPVIPPAPTRPIPPTWREPRPVPTAVPVAPLVREPTMAVAVPRAPTAETVLPTVAPTVAATVTPTPARTATPAATAAATRPPTPAGATPAPASAPTQPATGPVLATATPTKPPAPAPTATATPARAGPATPQPTKKPGA
jgi:beta-lactamase class A